jgi:hypothetical protein
VFYITIFDETAKQKPVIMQFGNEKSTIFAAGFGFFQPKINRESCENQELCP